MLLPACSEQMLMLYVSSGANDSGAVDLSSLDFLKESFHMAGSYNWNGVDLTQFPGEFFYYSRKINV